jgi:hypothetical protein
MHAKIFGGHVFIRFRSLCFIVYLALFHESFGRTALTFLSDHRASSRCSYPISRVDHCLLERKVRGEAHVPQRQPG